MRYILLAVKNQYRDRVRQRVDDPILRDTCLSIFDRFLFGIPLRLIGAHNFDHEICASPILILRTRVVSVEDEQQVRFAKLSRPYLKT